MHDMLESQLISLLEENATQTSEELAEQLYVSSSTIRRRKEELIKLGTLHIVAIPEPKKIGLNLTVIVAFDVAHDNLNSALHALRDKQEVKCLYATSGRYDVIALMWFSSPEQLYKFMEEEVAKMKGIKNTETFICMRSVKTFWSKDI